MTGSQIIVLATPVFLLLMAGEFLWAWARSQRSYRLNDAITSVGLGVLSQLGGLFTKLLAVGIYTLVHAQLAWADTAGFWSTWYGLLLALVFYDFCYYWHHRAGHEVAVFWAAHVVHHQSEAYNLSTALRQSSSGALLGWVFYLPMAVAGVPPVVFGIVALIDLLYQFWVHTELVGKLGWFDRVFCAPSNHRVHHAVNERYLDRNYGGILIAWDRLFGTYREETEPCVYGTRSPLHSWDPLWANAEVYCTLARDSWRTGRWPDKLRLWLKPPGWQPVDLAQRWPRPAFALAPRTLFDPPLSRTLAWFAGLEFLLLLLAVAWVLWHAGTPGTRDSTTAIWSACLLALHWSLAAAMQGRISWQATLMLQSAAVATATSALGLQTLYMVFKPLPLLMALWWVAAQPVLPGRRLLVAALLASLCGDVLLMLPVNAFIPGLAAFLVAHLCYLALFRTGLRWFPNRAALAATLAVGLGMVAFLWQGLGTGMVLKTAVALYVLVIGLMAAQALGRGLQLRDRPAAAVAAGAVLFMLSDALLATNRFVVALPLSGLWVLGSYYAAQMLIVLHVGRSTTPTVVGRVS